MFVHLNKHQNKSTKNQTAFFIMILIQWTSHADSLPEKLIEYSLHERILQLSRIPLNSKRYLTLSTWQSNRASWVNWSWFFYLSRFILYPSKSHPNPQLILLCLCSVQNMPLFRSLKRDTKRFQIEILNKKVSRYTKLGQSSSLFKVIKNWPSWRTRTSADFRISFTL